MSIDDYLNNGNLPPGFEEEEKRFRRTPYRWEEVRRREEFDKKRWEWDHDPELQKKFYERDKYYYDND
jgi:hypothetical protein